MDDELVPGKTGDKIKSQICDYLIKAGVMLKSEVKRYTKVLDSYDRRTLLAVMVASWELKEAAGSEILTRVES